MKQEEAFLKAGGNVWYDLNKEKLGQDDPVSDALGMLNGFKPSVLVELGCADGWRVEKLRQRYDCVAVGIDPSINAISAGGSAHKGLWVGTALDLKRHVTKGQVDLLIYGYCLAFVDPDDYFQILADCDWALADGGIVIIHDAFQARPVKSNYLELGFKNGSTSSVWLHMMDFKRLWLAHPYYREIGEMMSETKFEAVTILQKRKEGAFTIIMKDKEALRAVYD